MLKYAQGHQAQLRIISQALVQASNTRQILQPPRFQPLQFVEVKLLEILANPTLRGLKSSIPHPKIENLGFCDPSGVSDSSRSICRLSCNIHSDVYDTRFADNFCSEDEDGIHTVKQLPIYKTNLEGHTTSSRILSVLMVNQEWRLH